jgi:hypothetical protein
MGISCGGVRAGVALLDEDGLFGEHEEEEDGDAAQEERGQCPSSDHASYSLVLRVVDVLPVDLLRLWGFLHTHFAFLMRCQSEGFPNFVFLKLLEAFQNGILLIFSPARKNKLFSHTFILFLQGQLSLTISL